MSVYQSAVGGILRFWIWLKSKWPFIKRLIGITIISALCVTVLFSVIVNSFDPTGFGMVDDTDRQFWIKFGPISALFLVLVKSIWDAVKSDGSIKHKIVSEYDQTDVKQMAKFMKDADNVVIYSGDFSYIYSYEPLYSALNDLSLRQNLKFLSYKSKSTVLSQSEITRNGKNCIISNLIESNSMSFEVPGEAKFSLVFKKGEEVLLYRHREGETDYITVFKANNIQTKRLVETVKTLVDVIFKAHPPS